MTSHRSVDSPVQVPASLQRQYLEAMGITSWAARYRLPHAAKTPRCESEDQTPLPVENDEPTERLHSLLKEPVVAPSPVDTLSAVPERPTPTVSPRSASSLLADATPTATLSTAESSANAALSAVKDSRVELVLHFTLQIAAIDKRWLIVAVQPQPPSREERRLLEAMLAAIELPVPSSFIDFQWPMIEGLPVEAPLQEAQQGVKAFLEGRAREGVVPEKLLLLGEQDDEQLIAFQQVIEQPAGTRESALLSLPVWQAPALSHLMAASAKAELWPSLHALGQTWRASTAARSSDS